ncbi:MAG: two-component sensor histidine kinase [Melioribacteraceae bacterium]|nr:MAG: two-component sensor histidine kinase [Melioribacteraceae bacterium]
MKLMGGPASLNIKLTLLAIAIVIAVATLLYTQSLVSRLQEREREIVGLYAKSFNYITSSSSGENSDFTFIFENIIQRIDFPLILTDSNDRVSPGGMGGGIKNIDIDSTKSEEEQAEFISEKIRELSAINEPIPITYNDTIVLAKIYYGDSDLVVRLRFYPYFQIVFAILFILIAYVGFSYLKRNEQSNIWVGMAKETAHQLGTPISSLMGWTEILKMYFKNPDKVVDAAEEMSNDLARLNKIANRFSKIGSKPELKEVNLYDVFDTVINYFQRRLPQTGKKVELILTGDKDVKVALNSELFEWVIENLTKNALDAMGNKEGRLEYDITTTEKHVSVEVTDNGKGIDIKKRREIFRPGYTTKKRGWGLGLSLSKRIVENYHHGKIFVKNSVIGEGTTFKIILKKHV